MLICYEKLVELGYLPENEIELLQAWLQDLSNF